jgi:hypothetical protein
MLVDTFKVDSPNVRYTDDSITSSYDYDTTELGYNDDGSVTVRPVSQSIEFKTNRKVPKVGYDPHSIILSHLSAAYYDIHAPGFGSCTLRTDLYCDRMMRLDYVYIAALQYSLAFTAYPIRT